MSKHTPSPWWGESGVIHAKGPNWTPESHSCVHVATVHYLISADNMPLLLIAPELLALAYATLEVICAGAEPWMLAELEVQTRAAIDKTESQSP